MTSPPLISHPRFFWAAVLVCTLGYFISWNDLQAPRLFAESLEDIDLETTAEDSAGEGDMGRRVAFTSLGLLGGIYLLLPGGRRLGIRGLMPWLVILFLLWCVVSATWSISPNLTSRRLVMMAFFVVAAGGLSKRLSLWELCLLTMLVSGTLLVIGIANELARGMLKPWTPMYQFCGTMHPNQQGNNCSLLGLSSLCLALHAKAFAEQGSSRWLGRFFWAVFVLALLMMALTRSRTSTGVFLLSITVVLALQVPARSLAMAGVGILWTGLAVVIFGSMIDLGNNSSLIDVVLMGRSEHAGSLSGRVPLWTKLLSGYFPHRPLEGFGFGAFWNTKHLYAFATALDWDIPDAHSIYLELVINVGLVGAVLYIAPVLLGLGRALGTYLHQRDPGPRFMFGLLLYGLLDGFAESGFVFSTFYTFVAGCGVMQLALYPDEQSEARLA